MKEIVEIAAQEIKNVIRQIFAKLGYDIHKKHHDPMGMDAILIRMHKETPFAMVFDIGANKGQSARAFRLLFHDAKIVSFEPHKPTFDYLFEYAASDPMCQAENLALGDVCGNIDFNENINTGTNSILCTDNESDRLFEDNPHTTKSITQVKIDRLEDYCIRHQIASIDFLKIDAQGYDLMVLKGCGAMLNPQIIRVIVVEVIFIPLYEKQARFDQILGLMNERGYKLYGLVGGSSDLVLGLYWSNAVFVKK